MRKRRIKCPLEKGVEVVNLGGSFNNGCKRYKEKRDASININGGDM